MPRDWTLGPDEIATLPVDMLAIEVLRDALANEEWSTYNWMNSAGQHPDLRQHGALRALGEAWGWLYAKGLVAPDYPKGAPSNAAMFVTRLGRRAAEHGLAEIQAVERLGVELHPSLEGKVRPQFLMGQYELAALAGMRAVEIRVRELAAPSGDQPDLGVKLMRFAFGKKGPLDGAEADAGERTGVMELFAGAIGTFKNPPSHREVDYDDPTEAAEVVLLADLLLRMLDRVSARLAASPRHPALGEISKRVPERHRPRPAPDSPT